MFEIFFEGADSTILILHVMGFCSFFSVCVGVGNGFLLT